MRPFSAKNREFRLSKVGMTGFEPVYLGNRPRVLGHYRTFPENEQLRMMLSKGSPAKGLRGWEHSGTIRGPFPCRRNALPLSYAPNRSSHAPYLVSYYCLLVSSRKLTKLLELSAQVVLGTPNQSGETRTLIAGLRLAVTCTVVATMS